MKEKINVTNQVDVGQVDVWGKDAEGKTIKKQLVAMVLFFLLYLSIGI